MFAVRARFDAESRRAEQTRRADWPRLSRGVALITSTIPAVFVSLLAPRLARAEEPPPILVRTVESVHDGCPTAPSFAERLTGRLARIHEAAESEAAVRVEIRVERAGNLSHGKLALDVGNERAEREASSPSCEEVLAALAVMAAIGLDEGTLPAAPAPPPPEGRPPHRQRGVLPAVPAPVSEGARGTRPTVAFGSGLEVSANRAPVIVPTLFGEVGLRVKYAPSLRLGVGRSFSQSFATRRGTASTRWSEVLFDACVTVLRREPLRLGPCISGEVGAMEAVVEAPLPFRSQRRWWVTTGASARLSWRVHPRLSLELEGGARVPLVVDKLFFEPDTVVYVPPVLVPFTGAAFVSRFR